MKKLIFILSFLVFGTQVFFAQNGFVDILTNPSDCFSDWDNGEGNGDGRDYLIRPEGVNFNSIRIWIRDIQFTTENQWLALYKYDPVTNQLGQNICVFDMNSSIEEINTVRTIDTKAIAVFFSVDIIFGKATFFDLCYEAVNLTISNNTYTNANGTFNDGSNISNYSPNIKSSYLIKPDNLDLVELSFTEFALGTGDNLIVYDGETEASPVLATFSKDNKPIVNPKSSGNSMLLVFSTDGTVQSQGWAVEYQGLENRINTLNFTYNDNGSLIERTITLGTRSQNSLKNAKGNSKNLPKYSETSNNTDISIFPNPTKGLLKVKVTGYDLTQKSGIYIYNTSGKLIKQLNMVNETNELDLSEETNGTYMLRIIIGEKVSSWKIVKN